MVPDVRSLKMNSVLQGMWSFVGFVLVAGLAWVVIRITRPAWLRMLFNPFAPKLLIFCLLVTVGIPGCISFLRSFSHPRPPKSKIPNYNTPVFMAFGPGYGGKVFFEDFHVLRWEDNYVWIDGDTSASSTVPSAYELKPADRSGVAFMRMYFDGEKPPPQALRIFSQTEIEEGDPNMVFINAIFLPPPGETSERSNSLFFLIGGDKRDFFKLLHQGRLPGIKPD
jgi:hypothetical protein